MNKKVVIIGGVAGGASAAARLRRLDEHAEIIIFERGEHISYANCGLPYHVGGVIESRNDLLLQTPKGMKQRYNIDVQTLHECISINPKEKTVTVKDLKTQEITDCDYDNLIIATGSSPVVPGIPGIDSKNIQTIWTVSDTDQIRKTVQEDGITEAVIVGGGFIGLEMAENLQQRGIKVSLVEMQNQVMPPLDFEMALLVQKELIRNGIDLYLGDAVTSFEDHGNSVSVNLASGKVLTTQLVILSIGVRPNSQLAQAAGLEVNARGGIVVDETLRTSDPAIYAVGDVIEVEDFIDKSRTMIPLAGPANKQGRIAADNIAGGNEKYQGTQGSSIVQIFDLSAASTGANEKTLIRRGLVRGKDYENVIIRQNSHAGYYPGATRLMIKILFSLDGNKIYGAQIVGQDGVDKRIDTLGVVIRLGGTIWDLKSMEFAYAPPYTSAKDPVNMAGFVAENLLLGKVSFAAWDIVEKSDPDQIVQLDVRENSDRSVFALPGSLNIPLGKLRDKIGEIDKKKEVIVFCAIGVRAYNAARILRANGFEHVKVYPGGMEFYQSIHFE